MTTDLLHKAGLELRRALEATQLLISARTTVLSDL